jgi:hypothetical protein
LKDQKGQRDIFFSCFHFIFRPPVGRGVLVLASVAITCVSGDAKRAREKEEKGRKPKKEEKEEKRKKEKKKRRSKAIPIIGTTNLSLPLDERRVCRFEERPRKAGHR